MNSIKRMLNVALCVILFSVGAQAATVVTVSVVPGKSVGLSDAGFFAGIVTLNIDGGEYLAMANNWLLAVAYNPSTLPGSSTKNLYTRNDILNGAPVLYYQNPERYGAAAVVFLQGLLAYGAGDALWAAGHNEMIQNILQCYPVAQCFPMMYSERVYDTSTNTTMMDVYQNILPGLDPNYDYSDYVKVINVGQEQWNEFLVFTSPVPVPSAIWLFGSGIIGMIAVARRYK